jgi:hypothetical protein
VEDELTDDDDGLDEPITVNNIIGNEVHTEYVQLQRTATVATASIASSTIGSATDKTASTMTNTPTAASPSTAVHATKTVINTPKAFNKQKNNKRIISGIKV